jgi:hypothetical protein
VETPSDPLVPSTKSKHHCLARQGSASCVIDDSFVLIFGGEDDAGCYKDCWKFEVATETFEFLGNGPSDFSERSYHTVTDMGNGVVWIIGGTKKKVMSSSSRVVQKIVADVWMYDIKQKVYRLAVLEGDVDALMRTSHGACVHPLSDSKILIFGGYSYSEGFKKGQWMNDIVEVDTCAMVCRRLEAGNPPTPRGYMSFTRFGKVCISLFGRSSGRVAQLVPSSKCIAVYDPAENAWKEECGRGQAPDARCNHRVSVHGDSIFMFGGKLDRSKGSQEVPVVSVLSYVKRYKAFQWSPVLVSRGAADGITDRYSHVQEIVNGNLYVMGGYSEKMLVGDWGVMTISKKRQRNHQHCFDIHGIPKRLCDPSQTVSRISDSHEVLESIEKRQKVHHLDLKKELQITDDKWKNASRECAFWKQVAEEEREKFNKASELLVNKEKEFDGLKSVVNSFMAVVTETCGQGVSLSHGLEYVRQQIHAQQATSSELRRLKYELEQSKMEKEEMQDKFKAVLDERAKQCKEVGEAYKDLERKMEGKVQELEKKLALINTDLRSKMNEINNLEDERSHLASTCHDLEQRVHQLQADVSSRQEDYTRLMEKMNKVKSMLIE